MGQVQGHYTGQLVFATSWRAAPNGGKGEVHAGTSVGMDSYPGIEPESKAPPTASVAQLLAGWNSFLSSHKYGTADSNVTIDEVGIEAVDGAYQTPYIAVSGTFNQSIQGNWFKAACEFYKAHKQSGIYFWGPDFTYNFGNLMTAPDSTQPEQLQPAGQPPSRPASDHRGGRRVVNAGTSAAPPGTSVALRSPSPSPDRSP